jgi:glycosyltransferase involved in cell wall biosynthesis
VKLDPRDEVGRDNESHDVQGRPLDIYCYWPHPHATASPLLLQTLRAGDTLVVQALPSLRGAAFGPISQYEVVRDLPDPTAIGGAGILGRIARTARLAAGRSRARSRLLQRDFDIGHIEMLSPHADWLDLRGLRRRLPLVSTVHDVRPHRPLPLGAETALLRRLYRDDRAGHLVVFHDVLKQELTSEFGVEAERVSVVPHPLDGRDLRDSAAARPERPFALVFGKLRRNKGIPVLLEALRSIGNEPEFDVVVAGGEGDQQLATRIADATRRLPGLRTEIGFVSAERKRELFSTASLVVLPYTRFHSQSGVLADAYAYRVPLLVTEVGALGETVRLDRTGWVVPPNDAEQLAATLCDAMQSVGRGADRAQELADAASRHDYRSVGPALRAVYDLAVSRS